MKNNHKQKTVRLFGVIAFAALIALLTACNQPTGGGGGNGGGNGGGTNGGGNGGGNGSGINLAGSTWRQEGWPLEVASLHFTASTYTVKGLGVEVERGTYRASGTTITLTITWVSPCGTSDGYLGQIWTMTIINNNRIRDDQSGNILVRVN